MGAEAQVHDAVREQQAGPLQVLHRVEGDTPVHAALARARHAGLDDNGAAGALLARSDVQGMEAMNIRPALLCLGLDIDGLVGQVNDGGAGDADLHPHVGPPGRVDLGGGNGWPQVGLPERGGRLGVVSIEGVNTVVGSCQKDDVVRPLAGDVDVRRIKGLRVKVAIHVSRPQLAEGLDVDVRRVQDRLVQIGARSLVVIVLRQHGKWGGVRRGIWDRGRRGPFRARRGGQGQAQGCYRHIMPQRQTSSHGQLLLMSVRRA